VLNVVVASNGTTSAVLDTSENVKVIGSAVCVCVCVCVVSDVTVQWQPNW